jgi:hypothetical protein
MMSKLLLLSLALLTGCASTIIDAGVYAATGKTTGSHLLSEFHQQDCNTTRLITNDDVCRKSYYGQMYYKKSSKDLISQY